MGEGFVAQLAYQRALGFDRDVFRRNLYRWSTEGNTYLRVLKQDLEPIGFMICFLTDCPFYDGTMAQEFAWWIEPEYRGQGYGKLLKDCYTLWALDKGATSLSIGVANFTEPAERMCDHLLKDGFELVDMCFIKRID